MMSLPRCDGGKSTLSPERRSTRSLAVRRIGGDDGRVFGVILDRFRVRDSIDGDAAAPSSIIVLRIMVMGVMGHSKSSSWPLTLMIPHGASGRGGAPLSRPSPSFLHELFSGVEDDVEVGGVGNVHLIRGEPPREDGEFGVRSGGVAAAEEMFVFGVMGMAPTFVPGTKLGTKTCLQNGA